jgi:tetratricopeptide (TPR) repeat protein
VAAAQRPRVRTETASSGRPVAAVLAALVTVLAGLWLYGREPAPRPTGPASGPAVRGPAPAAASIQTAAADTPVPPDPAFLLSPELPNNDPRPEDAALLARSRAALESEPMDAEALYDTGRVLLRLGRIDEALAPLRQAALMRGDQWPQAFTFAYACALGQRWQDAVAGFRRARVLAPNDAVTSYDLALAQQKLSDYRGAAQEYAAAIALDSSSAAPRLGLAISLDRQGKAAEALVAYQEALKVMPGGPDADRVGARMRRLEGEGAQR